jgi:hypothetical protein
VNSTDEMSRYSHAKLVSTSTDSSEYSSQVNGSRSTSTTPVAPLTPADVPTPTSSGKTRKSSSKVRICDESPDDSPATQRRVSQRRPSALTTFSCEFTMTMHRNLKSHTAFNFCNPEIVDGVFSLQAPLTEYLWSSGGSSCVGGSGSQIPHFSVDDIEPIDVGMTSSEKEVMTQFMSTCLILESIIQTLCLIIVVAIAVTVLLWCVLLVEGSSGVSVSRDFKEIVTMLRSGQHLLDDAQQHIASF